MSSGTSNDNAAAVLINGPDEHGQAAMLLVESLIHVLIAREVITLADAIEVVDTAANVRADIAADRGESPDSLRRSLGLLEVISTSLGRDVP